MGGTRQFTELANKTPQCGYAFHTLNTFGPEQSGPVLQPTLFHTIWWTETSFKFELNLVEMGSVYLLYDK